MKKLLLIFTMFLLIFASACAKLPEQVKQGKAFTDKGFIVQDNLKYEIKEYNFGRVVGSEVVESGTYYNVRLEISNVGSKKDKIPMEEIKLQAKNETLKPDTNNTNKANKNISLTKEIAPGEKTEGWLVFPAKQMPETAKLFIKDSVIEIQ